MTVNGLRNGKPLLGRRSRALYFSIPFSDPTRGRNGHDAVKIFNLSVNCPERPSIPRAKPDENRKSRRDATRRDVRCIRPWNLLTRASADNKRSRVDFLFFGKPRSRFHRSVSRRKGIVSVPRSFRFFLRRSLANENTKNRARDALEPGLHGKVCSQRYS